MWETERSSHLLSRSPSVRGNHNNQHQGSPEAEVRKTSAVGKAPWSRGSAEEGREAIWRPESSFPAFLPWPSSTGHSGQRQWQWLETGVQTSHRTRGQRSSVERSGEPVFITAVIYHGTKNKTHTPRRFTQVAIFITLRVNSLCLNLLNVFGNANVSRQGSHTLARLFQVACPTFLQLERLSYTGYTFPMNQHRF